MNVKIKLNGNTEYAAMQAVEEMGGWLVVLPLLIMGLMVLYLVAWCKMFKKAGLPWERVFVPCYGGYWMYKIADCAWMFWVQLAMGFVPAMLLSAVGESSTIAGVLGSVILLLGLVMAIIYCARLAKAYGKGGGFAVGLFFLHPIFIMILGYGSAEYGSARKAEEAYQPLPETWRCQSCGCINFDNQAACRECGKTRE